MLTITRVAADVPLSLEPLLELPEPEDVLAEPKPVYTAVPVPELPAPVPVADMVEAVLVFTRVGFCAPHG